MYARNIKPVRICEGLYYGIDPNKSSGRVKHFLMADLEYCVTSKCGQYWELMINKKEAKKLRTFLRKLDHECRRPPSDLDIPQWADVEFSGGMMFMRFDRELVAINEYQSEELIVRTSNAFGSIATRWFLDLLYKNIRHMED